MKKGRILAASLPLLCGPLFAGSEADALLPATTPAPADGLDLADYINASRFAASYTLPMDFDRNGGEVSAFNARLGSFIGAPVKLGGNLTYLGYLDYGVTQLDFDSVPVPVGGDNDLLHRVSFSSMFVYNRPGSRWFHGLYVEPSLRSDFEHLDAKDLFLSFALASAYQVNERLVIGAGVYGSDLLNEPSFIGGPGFVWTPTDDWFISYYGPRFIARRELGDDNQLGFEVANNGGYWNVETLGASTKLDLRSWRAGLLYRHRIAGELWLETGVGYTFGNKLSLSTPGGTGLFESQLGQLDSAPYGFVGLTMRRW